MNTSKDLVMTDKRAQQAFDDAITRVTLPRINEQIKSSVDNERLRTGVIRKFYPWLDKAEVKFDNVNKKVLCKVLHRFGGELLDLFTPNLDRWGFDDKLKERYIVPRGAIHVVVANLHDADSDEHLILGSYQNEELVGLNPAAPGNFKIATRGGHNQFWLKFGYDGLDIRLPNTSTMKVGEMDKDMTEIDYADATTVYTKEEVYSKDEVYTKEEVDELIREAIQEALGEDGADDTTH